MSWVEGDFCVEVAFMHEEECLRVDVEGARTNADAADYFQAVVLEVSQVFAFEVSRLKT